MKESIKKLKELTEKRYIFFTDRGNTSILLALKLAKKLGKEKLLIQDQGGWLTYSQYGKKLKFEIINLPTESGIIDITQLSDFGEESCLLINSMPGYFCLQPNMNKIKLFLINDVSGSIGRKEAIYGDIIVGSFGKWKPIEVGEGGFIGYDNEDWTDFFRENFNKKIDYFDKLEEQLELLPEKIKKIDKEVEKIKSQLKNFDIIHRDSKGLNVVVRYKSEEEKLKIIDYCKIYNYEFTLCPRYIRVMEPAVSIEVKRG